MKAPMPNDGTSSDERGVGWGWYKGGSGFGGECCAGVAEGGRRRGSGDGVRAHVP